MSAKDQHKDESIEIHIERCKALVDDLYALIHEVERASDYMDKTTVELIKKLREKMDSLKFSSMIGSIRDRFIEEDRDRFIEEDIAKD